MRQLMQEYSVYFNSSFFNLFSCLRSLFIHLLREAEHGYTGDIVPLTFGASCRYPVIFSCIS